MKTCMKDERKERETKDETEQGQIGEVLHSGSHWRGLLHTSDYFRKQENSHMWKHVSEAHPGEEPKDVNVVKYRFIV